MLEFVLLLFGQNGKIADLILTVENTTIVCNPSISDQQGRNQKISKVKPKMTTIIPKFRLCLKLTLLYCLLKEKKHVYFFEPNFGFMSGIQYQCHELMIVKFKTQSWKFSVNLIRQTQCTHINGDQFSQHLTSLSSTLPIFQSKSFLPWCLPERTPLPKKPILNSLIP